MEKPIPKTRPLSYLSFRYILGFLEPNFRIQLALQIPEIRSIIACLPLKIDYLKLDTTSTTINHLRFTVSVFREYSTQKPPLEVNGKVDHDLDEFGFRFHPEVAPGDVVLCEIPQEIVSKAEIKSQLRLYRRRFSNFYLLEEQEEEAVAHWRRQLLPFEYQKKGKKSPCKLHLQLEVYNDETSENQVFRFPYTMRIPDALRELNSILFGNRRVVCDVERLEIDTPILRLALAGKKMRVAEVEIGDFHLAEKTHIERNINFDALKSLIHETSFPLHSLKFHGQKPFPGMFDSEVLKDVTNLILYRQSDTDRHSWGAELVKLSAFKYFGWHDVEFEDCQKLIQVFQQNECAVRTSYSFRTHLHLVEEILQRFREDPERIGNEDDYVIFPMINPLHCVGVFNKSTNNDAVLEIGVYRIAQDQEEEDDEEDDNENDDE